jgi:hypothetical protein
LFKLPTLVDPIFTTTHGARDRDKKIVGNFLVERIRKLLFIHAGLYTLTNLTLEKLIGGTSDHFRWEGWCDVAYKHRLVLVGWDRTVQAPGPDFSLRGAGAITMSQWQCLVKRIDWKGNPFYDPTLPRLDIRLWDGECLMIFV